MLVTEWQPRGRYLSGMPNFSKIMAILALGILGTAYLIARPGGPFTGQDPSNATSPMAAAQPIIPGSPPNPVPQADASPPNDEYLEAQPEPEDMSDEPVPEEASGDDETIAPPGPASERPTSPTA